MALTEKMHELVEESASLGVRFAARLKHSGLDILIWASPLSCRNPEENMFWHPLYSKRPVFIKMLVYLYVSSAYFLVGIMRFFTYRGFYYHSVKKQSPVLLVIPDKITDHSSAIRTTYLIEDEDFPIDKIVFSRLKNLGFRFCALPYFDRSKIFIKIATLIIYDFVKTLFHKKITYAYLDSLVIFLQWFLSQSWYFHWDFYHFVNEVINSNAPRYKVLVSVHEMHFYSKIMWRVAKERGLKSLTTQHAMIIPEKLWYFSNKKELNAGCPTPDIFFVYSDRIKNMLRPFYPKTEFPLCCSPRFNKWKSKDIALKNAVKNTNKSFILFVSGIMYYDVTILIQAIRNLLGRRDYAGTFKIRLRLHPNGKVKLADSMWIKFASRTKKIKISKFSLKEDLSGALLVVGSNSTVLQEAALLGTPVLSISCSNYVHPSILPDTEEWKVSVDNLSWGRFKEQMSRLSDNELIERIRRDMGMYSPNFTTELIYKTADLDLEENVNMKIIQS